MKRLVDAHEFNFILSTVQKTQHQRDRWIVEKLSISAIETQEHDFM